MNMPAFGRQTSTPPPPLFFIYLFLVLGRGRGTSVCLLAYILGMNDFYKKCSVLPVMPWLAHQYV